MAAAAPHEKLLAEADEEQRKMMEERVILTDYYDNEIGHGSKKETHIWSNIEAGMLHRAFSVFLFTPDGKLILQQRSPVKITFPLIWANTCCSHPLHVSSELIEENARGVKNAARRKLEQELGIPPEDVPLDSFTWITRVHYEGSSVEKDGSVYWGEHEIDWIMMCAPGKKVRFNLNPNEVANIREFTQAELKEFMATRHIHGNQVSPWFGCMEASGLLYKWWDAVLERRLDTVLQRDVIHRQHDLEALAQGKQPGAVGLSKVFKATLAATQAAGTTGPRVVNIPCEPVHPNWRAAAGSQVNSSKAASSGRRGASPAARGVSSTTGSAGASTAVASKATQNNSNSSSSTMSSRVALTAAVPDGSGKQDAAIKKQGAYGKVTIHKDSLFTQLSHMDEVFTAVGYKLGLVQPVKVAALAADASADLVFCEAMLCRVSRSFAMVIQQLPPHLRTSICVFYLVLRGLDTVEDDMETFKDKNSEKLKHLNAFHSYLSIPGWTMSGVGEGDEKHLLEHFHHVNAVFAALSQVNREVIADICKRMGEGMADFSGRDLREGTIDRKDYNLYCHYVAGLVGEGLSKLFVAHGDEDAIVGQDMKLADDMGLFLQKTNIIRDYLEDLVDGRAFWPKEIWGQYAVKLADLRAKIDNASKNNSAEARFEHDQAMACLNHMVADALTLAPSCLRYMERLHDPDVFKFCAIPQVMAIATLDKLAGNPDVFTGVVKIRKGQALLLMSQAGSMTSVYTIFLRHARSIMASIPPHHKAAYASASVACKEVEDICLAALQQQSNSLSGILFDTRTVLGSMVVLAALLQHLYKRSKSAGWGDGAVSYMPRITDSWDVAAVVGVVVLIAYLFAMAGVPLALGRGSGTGTTPPASPRSSVAAKGPVGLGIDTDVGASSSLRSSSRKVVSLINSADDGSDGTPTNDAAAASTPASERASRRRGAARHA